MSVPPEQPFDIHWQRDIVPCVPFASDTPVLGISYKRPSETDAHHVVAAEASDAYVARMIIFAVGIGINDRDNGVILPKYKTTRIKGMLRASPHQHIHTDKYYSNVVTELLEAKDMSDQQQIRAILRLIAGRLQKGRFVY